MKLQDCPNNCGYVTEGSAAQNAAHLALHVPACDSRQIIPDFRTGDIVRIGKGSATYQITGIHPESGMVSMEATSRNVARHIPKGEWHRLTIARGTRGA